MSRISFKKKDIKPRKPGLIIKKFIAIHGCEAYDTPEKFIAVMLSITESTAKKMLNGNKPFLKSHITKIKKKAPINFPIDEFAESNRLYEQWREKEKPRTVENVTPDRIIISLLRQLFLRSRERSIAVRNAHHRCEKCGVSDKDFRFQCHHKIKEINWDKIISVIREELLCSPEEMMYICTNCHNLIHGKKARKDNGK